jgi:hypothetical protein
MAFLKKLWQGWLRFGHLMGDIVARVVMTIFYFTLLLPFGVLVTLLSDPLDMRRKAKAPAWLSRTTGDQTLEEAQKQF